MRTARAVITAGLTGTDRRRRIPRLRPQPAVTPKGMSVMAPRHHQDAGADAGEGGADGEGRRRREE